ncbi:MAG TPA: endolytic transglycosylase MltG [Bryobacteraceae bacterium]|nr:endolytic transglycosylase MltG [Bryobacteraceae bacterium]
MTRGLRRMAGVLVLALALAGGAAVAALELPYQGFQGEKFIVLKHGESTPTLARALEEWGVVRYRWQFWLARALHPRATLQAGEYRFAGPSSVRQVFERIAKGDIYYFEVTIPEGSNMFDIARLLEAVGAMPAQSFLKAAADPAPVRDLDPQAQNLEGYLFPATYRLSHATTAADLCRTMTAEFRREWKKLAPAGTGDPHHAVTLASMIEKETGIPAERPLVASVFTNRLALGRTLDCDPTIIYAALLDHHYRGTIYRSDLDKRSPYNTYRNAGLPPGPIANPGAQAITAALHPADTDYLYFVAKPSGGGHQFSSSLAAHENAVRAYRHGSPSSKHKLNGKKSGKERISGRA